MKPGDAVRYSTDYCRQVSAPHEITSMRGVVEDIRNDFPCKGLHIVNIRWMDGTMSKSLKHNLSVCK